MEPKLRLHVHVTDDSGVVHVFGPHSAVPDWARARITNPKAWDTAAPTVDDVTEVDDPAAVDEAGMVPLEQQDTELADDEDGPGPEPGGELPEPPRNGPGSGRDKWAAYAASRGVTVDEQMSRDDIMAAVDERRS